MGFCLLNNVAVAAQHALDAHHLERVLIVDYDVHHGNGTQDIFFESSRVLYFSVHQYPHYPGTGHWSEIGEGDGSGYTVNVPLPPHVGDDGYLRVFDNLLVPLAERFVPQIVLVSVGFDAHWRDPLASEDLSVGGYASLAQTCIEIARTWCGGRIVFALEGGYDLNVLSEGAAASFRALLGDSQAPDSLGRSPRHQEDIRDYVDQLRGVHRLV
jgi:acetoin utilization deacetylase AcuC-like enzyme